MKARLESVICLVLVCGSIAAPIVIWWLNLHV